MYVRIPGIGEVNLADKDLNIMPIVRSEPFQLLRHKRQLGQAFLVFPGATHSRFEHSIGAFARTKDVMLLWHRQGLVGMADVITVCVFALLHDIGHPPFSHTLEPLFLKNHHLAGIDVIRSIADCIIDAGTSVEMMERCLEKKHQFASVVSTPCIGTEQLDYLWRDAHHTGTGGSPDIGKILTNLVPVNNHLALRKRAWQEGLALVNFSQMMYERLYETSKSIYARRLVQKLYEQLHRRGGITEEALTRSTDAFFEGACAISKDDEVQKLFRAYTGVEELPRTGLLICQKPYGKTYRRKDKPYRRIVELERNEFAKLVNQITWKRSRAYEERVAAILACDPVSVYVPPSREARRYAVPKIEIIDGDETVLLSDMLPGLSGTDRVERVSAIRIGLNGSLIYGLEKHIDKLLVTLSEEVS